MNMSNVLPAVTKVSEESSGLRTLADYNILKKLLQHPQYKIPEYLRAKAINCVEKTLEDDDNSAKLKLSAINTMLSMDKHNLDLAKVAMPKKIESIDPRKMNDEELMTALQEIKTELDLKLPKVINHG